MRNFLCSLLVVLYAVAALPAQESTIPLRMDRGMPFVEVMVNGKGPFLFGIDTGTGGDALVSPELAERLQLPKAGEMQVGDPSGQNAQKRATFRIASLKVGAAEFKDVEAVSHAAQPVTGGTTDGIIGFTLFQEYLWTLDYPNARLNLHKGELAQAAGVIPFTTANGVPQIELKISGSSFQANLDSRGQGFSLPAAAAQDLKFATVPVVVGKGRTVSNEFEVKGARLSGDVDIAGFKLPRPFIVLNPVFNVGNVGSVVLRHFAITFDEKSKLVRFASPEKTIDIAPPGEPRGNTK